MELARFDHDSVSNVWSKEQAILRSYWCTTADAPTLRAWFDQTLTRAGWERERLTDAGGADEVATDQWRLGRRSFTLYLLSEAYLARRRAVPSDPASSPDCVTGYATRVL